MKYTVAILLTIMSLVFSGCSESWLNDVEPQGKLLEINYYQTEDEMSKALVAVYNMFKNQYWQGVWASWYIMGSVNSDDACCMGGGRADRPEMWAVQDYTVTPITDGVLSTWDRSYYGINRANVVIDRVDPSSAFGKIAIAEAKMLRAYFYFDLIRYFGEVPLIDHVLTPTEYEQGKAPLADIFALIVQDLKDASADLPVRWTGGDRYRMTKYAAHGFLGKVYMYMASPYYNISGGDYYALAAEQLKKVIAEGGYALEADYDKVWWYGNEFNNETLMEVSYGPDAALHWDNGANGTGNVIIQLNGPRGLIGGNDTLRPGWGFDMVTQDLVDAYRTQGDSVRLHGTVLAEWQWKEWGYDVNAADGKREGYTGYYTKKRTTWTLQNPVNDVWSWNNNERILRLADIYLLLAEAQSKGAGTDAEAIANADIVRARAGLGSISDVMSAQGLSLYEAIKLERRLELAQECNRFFDLVRWGDAGKVLGPLGFVEGKNEHYPIPQEEIDASNGKLTQSEPYQ